MILAAGLGTRLRPLTADRPKALVEINGRTLLEITLARLRTFGVRDVIVNVHHFADMIVDYLKKNRDFGMRVEISREDTLLDTGGGLKKAAWFFLDDSPDLDSPNLDSPNLDSPDLDAPFILHNVDVISTVDLKKMLQFHIEGQALATLAVQDRKTSRYLLFDEASQLCGRRSEGEGKTRLEEAPKIQALGFCGIHVISPRLLPMLTEEGAFSVIASYLRLAAQAQKIKGFRADQYYWRDLGKPENVVQASEDLKQKVLM